MKISLAPNKQSSANGCGVPGGPRDLTHGVGPTKLLRQLGEEVGEEAERRCVRTATGRTAPLCVRARTEIAAQCWRASGQRTTAAVQWNASDRADRRSVALAGDSGGKNFGGNEDSADSPREGGPSVSGVVREPRGTIGMVMESAAPRRPRRAPRPRPTAPEGHFH
ncbi:hypothetical protein EVAR_45275_1 [Eumeta japonica]|uniref:Uncharacterized protein n=1 Tax=Eumeta variegata TaxID=151549 RepID=A0A4C1XGB9_EUMVA|nr:hypothetical protein EVAR_45275_1 [Eumeta japonica]